ncbi:tetratricopeptide repeat protein [Kribbella sp. NBC_01505]|uniref:AfsR/SARP family transcriptional regulator n=1 Tax=Kribbella sp. NBC_01505 TaxID=2903580 RepID=UPI00386C0EF5
MGSAMDGSLDVLILGPTLLRAGGTQYRVDRPLERALLVRLALARGHGVPDGVLAAAVWGDGQVEKPGARLRVLAHRLRRTLGDQAGLVHRSDNGYALSTSGPADLAMVEQMLPVVEAARRDRDYSKVSAAVADALAQWRGPALADLRRTPFGAVEAARLDRLFIDLQTDRLEARLALGTVVVTEADELARKNPLNERLLGLAVIALYRAGRQAEALARIATLRAALADQLGIDPSRDTVDLELKLLRQDPSLLPATPPPPIGGPALPGAPNPRQPQSPTAQTPAARISTAAAPTAAASTAAPTAAGAMGAAPRAAGSIGAVPVAGALMVGRDGDLAALLERLARPAVVTLTGGPGVGKTRLAKEVSAAVNQSGRAVYWLDLTAITTAEAVLPGLASVAAVEAEPDGLLSRCVEKLAGGLLILDNAEHLVESVGALLSGIVDQGDQVSVLVTSQQPVRVVGEHVHPIGPLGREAAVRLFRERSRVPSDGQTLLIDEICTAVDRLPLAIELAAGLTRTLTIEQLALRIEDRLRLLVGGMRSAGRRHTSLRSAIDWSSSLLDPVGREVLHRTAVFVGGFTLDAAEQVVCGEDLAPIAEPADLKAILADLCERSLVTLESGEHGDRFVLLQSIRDYALEQLHATGNESAVRGRHATWCAALAARTFRDGGPDHEVVVHELNSEAGNLRAAVEWALRTPGEAGRVLEIAAPTGWYWMGHGLIAESRDWLRRALDAEDEAPTETRAAALRAAASLARTNGDPAGARLLGDEALRIYRLLDEPLGLISALIGLSFTNLALGDLDVAVLQAQEAVTLAEPTGNTRLHATSLNITGGVLHRLGRTVEAEQAHLAACDLWRSVDDHRGLAGTLSNLGQLYLQMGNLEGSRERSLEALRIYHELDLVDALVDCLDNLAAGELAAGQHRQALRLVTVAEAQRIRAATPLLLPDEIEARDTVEQAARTALGAEAEAVAAAAQDEPITALVDELLNSKSV